MNSRVVNKRFGDYLRSLREERDIPIRKVAASLDLDQSTLSKFERCERLPKDTMLPKIADFFSLKLEDLRLLYLSDRVLSSILKEENPEQILNAVSEKLRYLREQKFNQGKLDF